MFRHLQNSAFWLIISATVIFSACSGKPDMQTVYVPSSTHVVADKPIAADTYNPSINAGVAALEVARSMLGVAYRYGGADPGGFDCSGLVQYSFRQAGINLPRTSQQMFRNCQLIHPQDLQPGDLVFFRISAKKISHVGIYAGNRTFIHSPSSGKGVSYASLSNSYWQKRLVGAGRI